MSLQQSYAVTSCKVVGAHWTQDKTPEECCRDQVGGTSDFAFWFCMSLCALCCWTLHIDYKCDDPTTTAESSQPRDYPTVVPTDNGISFTMSQYGAPLPIVFGSDKLPGNVFWASPVRKVLLEGGTEYYQTIDFAFGLCEGEINGMLRLWMGDKLLIDNTANVDENGVMQPNNDGFITGRTIDLTDPNGPLRNLAAAARATKVTVMSGGEYQLPEGIYAQREGWDNVPGYRGTAYVLFENFIVTDTSIPALFVEVTSNTDNNYPRLYANIDAEYLDDLNNELQSVFSSGLIVDPFYNRVYWPGRSTNSATVNGYHKFTYDTMEYLGQDVIVPGLLSDLTSIPSYETGLLLPTSGMIFLTQANGNAGRGFVYNPHAGSIADQFPIGGGLSGDTPYTAVALNGRGSTVVTMPGTSGPPVDVVMTVGFSHKSASFIEVDVEGKLKYSGYLSETFPVLGSAFLSVGMTFAPGDLTAFPTFVDGASPLGTHFFSIGNKPATTELFVYRTSVAGLGTIEEPVQVEMATIDKSLIGGVGNDHVASSIIVDPTDKCIVVFFATSSTSPYPFMMKWSPYTGEVIYVKTMTSMAATDYQDFAFLSAGSFAYMGLGTQGLWKVDLATGEIIKIVDGMSSENLPAFATGSHWFYDGYENTLLYTSQESGKRFVKTYMERVTRSTIELSRIIELLLKRVGLLPTDIDVEDLTTITLNGYTISEKKSLHDAFSELGQVFKFDVIESNGKIKYKARGTSSGDLIEHKHLTDVSESGWIEASDENDLSRIRKINLTYRDIEREYAQNVQSIILPRYGSLSFDNDAAIDVSVPVVLEPETARKLAEILLYAKLTYDTTYQLLAFPRYLNLDPGDVVDVEISDTETQALRLRKVTVNDDRSVKMEASQEDPDIYNDVVNLFGAVGRYDPSILPAVRPRMDAMCLTIPGRSFPEIEETDGGYSLFFAFLNYNPGSSIPGDVEVQINGSQSYTLARPTNFPTWGFTTKPLEVRRDFYATDFTSVLRVKLVGKDGIVPESVTLDDIINSDTCNLMYVGGELVQYASAVDLGNDLWEFTVLNRARLGTEAYVGTQFGGDRVVLLGDSDGYLDEGGIRRLDLPADQMAKFVVQIFLKSGNPMQPNPVQIGQALNRNARAVSELRGAYATNDLVISWQRQTRFGGDYPDDGSEQTPLNEVDESYEIYIFTDPSTFFPSDPSTYLRTLIVTTNSYTYDLAAQTADGFDNTTDTAWFVVSQRGSVEGYRTGVAQAGSTPPKV